MEHQVCMQQEKVSQSHKDVFFTLTSIHWLIYSKKAIVSEQCPFWSWLNTKGNIDVCEYKRITATKHTFFSVLLC